MDGCLWKLKLVDRLFWLPNVQTFLRAVFIMFKHFHQPWYWLSKSTPSPALFIMCLLYNSHSARNEILICISLMISDTEQLFHVPLAHLDVFFEKISVHILYLFLNWITCYLAIELYDILIFNINPFSDISCLSHSIGWLFILLIISFAIQKLFTLM